MADQTDRNLLLQLIGSLTLCDHMGDVSNDVQYVLTKLGINDEWEDWPQLAEALHVRGVTTLYGTSLAEELERE